MTCDENNSFDNVLDSLVRSIDEINRFESDTFDRIF